MIETKNERILGKESTKVCVTILVHRMLPIE